MKTILFQGDSITDADRSYSDDNKRGLGYPQLVTARLGYDAAGEYNFINRGISGNRIVDVYARIKKDIININPDIMSILIGVNDVWHEINYNNGVETEKFENGADKDVNCYSEYITTQEFISVRAVTFCQAV